MNNSIGVGHHEDKGDWIDGNGRHGHNKLKFEKMKCLEKNIKEIVGKENIYRKIVKIQRANNPW